MNFPAKCVILYIEMQFSEDLAVDAFLRSYQHPFTLKDFRREMSRSGYVLSQKEGEDYLAESPYVFYVKEGEFVTRAAAFTDRFFSFTVTPDEIKNKMFIPGHRFMPFVDEMQNPAAWTFVYDGKILPRRIGEFRKEIVLDLNLLYGEEYETQYIASDPAMADYDLSDYDFELPPRIKVTGCDISSFIDTIGFTSGDRILCRVINWDKGIIEVFPRHKIQKGNSTVTIEYSDRERLLWNDLFEKSLIKVIEREGPCTTIEEQLAFAFFDNLDGLCTVNCDSVENYLAYSKKIDLELFGVETRLWYMGHDVPAVGSWNNVKLSKDVTKFSDLTFRIPPHILDSYIRDFEYSRQTDISVLIKRMFPENFVLNQQERDYVLLHIDGRHAIIKKEYNYFADYPVGQIRQKALLLYGRVVSLVYDVETSTASFDQFPQNELVILSQLFTHLNRILESIEANPDAAVEDLPTLDLSLEGMEYNFEDIEDVLRYTIDTEKRNSFKII